MEKPKCMSLLCFLYPQTPFEVNYETCNGVTHVHRYLSVCLNSPFNCLPYAKFKVITLYTLEHKSNYVATKCFSSHFDELSTPLALIVHSYRTKIKMGVN